MMSDSDYLINLIEQGKTGELIEAYEFYRTSWPFIFDHIKSIADEPDETQLVSAQIYARNLMDDMTK
jgi:hypothetical protein